MFEHFAGDGSPLHWKDYGGQGSLIVMVHGLGGSLVNWDVVGPRLAKHHRVVALDLPGFGLSPPGRDFELSTHAEAIVDFVSTFDEPAILLGNSMGGLLSQMVAAEHPDLVSALVLIAPATPPRLPDPNINWPMATRLAINAIPGVGVALSKRILKTRTSEELVRESLNRITQRTSRIPLDMIDSFVRVAELRRHYPWAALSIPKTGQSISRYLSRPSKYVEMIRRVTAPTLVVQGVDDPIVSPTWVSWACSLRSDWELVQLQGTGHTPQIDAPVRLLGVVEPWLTAHQKHRVSA